MTVDATELAGLSRALNDDVGPPAEQPVPRRPHRNHRHRDVRAQVIPVARLVRHPNTLPIKRPDGSLELRQLPELTALEARRPRRRSECIEVERPCPFVSCRYHLWLNVQRTGSIKLTFPDLEPWEMPAEVSCALDVAEDGGVTLERLGEVMNLTRERARQLQDNALAVYEARKRAMKREHEET